MKLCAIDDVYPNFTFPESILKAVELNLIDFDWWYLMPEDQVRTRIKGLQTRYPQRKLIPFARRDDSDDIACFEIGKGAKVEIIHDFAGNGFEQRQEYDDFWEWFQAAIDEMIENTR